MTGRLAPSLPLDPSSDDLWTFVDAVDEAYFAGNLPVDRTALLLEFDRVLDLIDRKNSTFGFVRHAFQVAALTFTPFVISVVFFDSGLVQVFGFLLSCFDAFLAARSIERKRRDRAEYARIRQAISARLRLLGV